jgi:hypothetical protein
MRHLFPTLLLLSALATPALADPPEAKTGSFQLTFTERSPLTELKSLTRRLKVPIVKSGDTFQDYDLSKESFLVYVPEKYDPQKPLGLIVLANYKHSGTLPDAVLPQLADANVALIVPNEYVTTWWHRAGLDLDAAFNMQKRYAIDPHRVYVFGGGDWPDDDGKSHFVAERLGLFYPEVFTGTFTVNPGLYRPYQEPMPQGIRTWQPSLPHPDPPQIALAKTHPFVGGLEGENESTSIILKAYKADGFTHFKFIPFTGNQYHYPNYTTDWIPDVLAFMDPITAKLKLPAPGKPATPPADQPVTKPATNTGELRMKL